MSHSQQEPGFYGKLPILGDFVSRRLPRDFLNAWDRWLQSSIAASKEELGEAWLNSYLNSPIWRFVLSPGVCGSSAWAGILMPSVDKVGRYFPLTVAARFAQPAYLPYLLSSAGVWFERLEAAALSGLEDGLQPEVFDGMIRTIEPVFFPSSTPEEEEGTVFEPNGKKAFLVAPNQSEHISEAFTGLSAVLLKSFMPGYSLWATGGSDVQEPALLTCEGLPPLSAFSGFLEGRFSNRGWNIRRHVPPINIFEPALSANAGALAVSEHSNENQDTLPRFNDTASQSPSIWRSWALTDRGKRRKYNEDAILDKPEARLWAVADGMGGHSAGDVASQLIVDRLQQLTPNEDLEAYVEEVSWCIAGVNQELRALSNKSYNDSIIGSTILVLIGNQNRCAFLWAGDSRLYRFRDNKLEQLTRDHCAANEIVPEQAVSPSGWTVKQSNVITRAVGADDELELECRYTDVLLGDLYLLSSDGLDKELSFNEIESILLNRSLENSAQALLDLALDRGARDNISVIVVSTGNSLEE